MTTLAVRTPQTLRPRQNDAASALIAAMGKGDKPICAMPTGTGKTTVIADVLVRMLDPHQHRALVVAHTQEIIYQLYERIINQFGGALDEWFGLKPGIGIVMGDQDAHDARIVIATRQSLHKRRLAKLLQHGGFDMMVIDECHRSYAGNSYGEIVSVVETATPRCKRFGMSATPFRGDNNALESLWTGICYQYSLTDAVREGLLVPITRVQVATHVDASSIKTQRGDYSPQQLVSALEAENWLDLCLAAFAQHIPAGRATLAFMPTVEMSRKLAEGLNNADVRAAHIDGDTDRDERKAALDAFNAGNLDVLSNMAVFTEGTDIPRADTIFLGRPTRSRVLLTQIVGRGVRLYEGKTHCLVVDMTVQDTKMLEFGSIIGRMVTCRACGAEYYAFLDKCSACGEPKRRGNGGGGGGGHQFQTGGFVGKGLVASKHLHLISNCFAAWHAGIDALSCQIGFVDGTLVILPPDVDEYWRLYQIPDDRAKPVVYIDRNDNADALIKYADDLARKIGGQQCDRNAKWRRQPASDAQIAALRKVEVDAGEGITKGDAAVLLTHVYSLQRLQAELDRRVGQFRWIVDLERIDDAGKDQQRFQRILNRIDAAPGDDHVTILKRGGYFGLSRFEVKHPVHVDDDLLIYFATECAQAYLE